jgi:hypothetical protein
VDGKTVTESFAKLAEQPKVEHESRGIRRYRQLEASVIEVNEKIYRARSVDDTHTS